MEPTYALSRKQTWADNKVKISSLRLAPLLC